MIDKELLEAFHNHAIVTIKGGECIDTSQEERHKIQKAIHDWVEQKQLEQEIRFWDNYEKRKRQTEFTGFDVIISSDDDD